MFPYIGGKSHHVRWMDPLMPTGASRFVEVFGGAGWTTLKSKRAHEASKSIYNDANRYLANAWSCFTQSPRQLLERMRQDAPSQTQLYRQYQNELFGKCAGSIVSLGNVELASKYLYLQTQIFAGTPLSLTNVPYFVDTKSNGKYPSKYLTLQRKLENSKTLKRLEQIEVANLDYAEAIARYDSHDTLFYVDPPYHGLEFYYTHEFGPDEHARLAVALGKTKGKWALSYYRYNGIEDLYPPDKYEYHTRNVYRSASTRSGSRKDYNQSSRANEILIVKR
jgi:DNA adenine methylase